MKKIKLFVPIFALCMMFSSCSRYVVAPLTDSQMIEKKEVVRSMEELARNAQGDQLLGYENSYDYDRSFVSSYKNEGYVMFKIYTTDPLLYAISIQVYPREKMDRTSIVVQYLDENDAIGFGLEDFSVNFTDFLYALTERHVVPDLIKEQNEYVREQCNCEYAKEQLAVLNSFR